ncbi:MAG: ferritin-like domain-containing protein [Propionivibrio sp.]
MIAIDSAWRRPVRMPGAIAAEFLEHAKEKEEHADRFAERITQLGGEPDFSPDTLTARSHAEYVAGNTLAEMLKEDLIAERIAIESYREIIQHLGDGDPTTRRLFEEVLEVEEEHADELIDLIDQLGNSAGTQAIADVTAAR